MNGLRHAICAALTAALLPAGAAPPAGRPASAPASAPGLMPEPVSQPVPLEVVKAATVDEALAYTDGELTILADVNDRDQTVPTPALYVLLHRAAMLPDGPVVMDRADRPSLENLWKTPALYRGRLIQVEGGYLDDKPSGLDRTVRFAGPVHELMVGRTDAGQDRRIIVMMPRPLGRKPRPGRRIRIAGLFYKIVKLPDPDAAGAEREYAVVVAGRVGAGGSGGAGGLSGVSPPVLAMFGLVVLLLVGFFLLRRRTRRPAPAGGRGDYKPLRFEDAAAEDRDPGEADADAAVDEDLLRQVRQYQADHGLPTDQDHADHEDHTR